MFRGLFKPRSVSKGRGHKPEGVPGDSTNEEFQLPSLHRAEIHMTADLIQRMENERLRKEYQISPVKEGKYL